MNEDNWLTKEDFIRIADTGPENIVEALWFYLYVEGICKVPFAWEIARVCHLFGKPFLPLFRLCLPNNKRLQPNCYHSVNEGSEPEK